MPLFDCDSATTLARIDMLREYMDNHVFGVDGFVCSSDDSCRRSVMLGTDGTLRNDRRFSEGQLSHVGHHYDLTSDGTPLRILVIAMETGRDEMT